MQLKTERLFFPHRNQVQKENFPLNSLNAADSNSLSRSLLCWTMFRRLSRMDCFVEAQKNFSMNDRELRKMLKNVIGALDAQNINFSLFFIFHKTFYWSALTQS